MPSHIELLPVIVPGVAGIELTVTASVWNVEEPHELLAVTVIFPLVVPAVALILVVVELPVHPKGNVHVYDVAPETGNTEYVLEEPEQIIELPVMVPG